MWKSKPQASGADGTKIHDPQASDDNHRRHEVPNKDTHNKDTHTKEIATQGVAAKDLQELIDKFKPINPSYEKFFKNTTQRAALERLLKIHGREKIEWVLNIIPQTNARQFAPTITTPLQLEDNLAKLIIYLRKEQGKGPRVVTI